MATKKKDEYKASELSRLAKKADRERISQTIENMEAFLPEEVKKERAAEFFDLINNLSEGIALRDEAGLIIYANQTFVVMVQLNSPTEVVGMPYLEFVHPEDRPESIHRIELGFQGVHVPKREHRLVGVQGRSIFVSSTCEPTIFQGKPCLKGLFIDITERKFAEEKILRSAEIETVLKEIAESTLLSASLDELYAKVHRLIGQIFPTENFCISFLNEAGDQIVTPCFTDETGVVQPQRPVGRNMVEYVMRLGRTVRLNTAEYERLLMAGEVDPRFAEWKDWIGAPLYNIQGKIFGVVRLLSLSDEEHFQAEDIKFLSTIAAQIGMAIDRKRMECALRESEERLREVLENSLNAAYKRNLKTDVCDYLSPVFSRITGYSPEEIQGLPFEFIRNSVHPDDLAETKRVLTESESGEPGKVFHMEYRFRHKNGKYRWIRDQFTLVRYETGESLACIGSIMDINDRKQMEEALQASEKKFRQLVQKNPVPLCILQNSGVIDYISEQFTDFFGYTLEEIPTIETWWLLAYPDENYRRRVVEDWENAVAFAQRENGNIGPIERDICCKNGTGRIVEIVGIILGDSFLVSVIDITERRRNERLLQASYERKRKNELLNELINCKQPSQHILAASARMIGRRTMEPFSCYLLAVNAYHEKSKKYWMDQGEVYQILAELIIDTLTDDVCICWESTDGICVLCFDDLSASEVKVQQIRMAEKFRQSMALHMPDIDISIGIAERAESLAELGTHYQQALDALQVGRNMRRQRQIYHFLDIGIFQVLPYGNDQKQIKDYIERTLGKLMEYDKKIMPELLETLEVILESDNLKEAADTLSIHYKTLMYRKQRLEKILGVSLENTSSRMALAAAVHLMKQSKGQTE